MEIYCFDLRFRYVFHIVTFWKVRIVASHVHLRDLVLLRFGRLGKTGLIYLALQGLEYNILEFKYKGGNIMNKKLTVILAGIFFSVFSMITISEVQTMKNEGLNAKQEKIVTIAGFTANGDLQKLKTALNEGLDAGLTINEIKEVLVQLYAYAGFPRSLNSINTFIGVLEERQQKGIKDELGKEPSPMPGNKSSIELGTEIQTRLIGAPATGKYISFAPAIDQFLKGHLFGDIFGRDNLDFQSREIATISALANIEGVNPQLQSHFNVGFNVGLTEAQMRSLIFVLEVNVGKKEADNANQILSKALGTRAK